MNFSLFALRHPPRVRSGQKKLGVLLEGTLISITLVGSGGLFTRIGPLFGRIADCDALRGASATSNVLSAANLNTNLNTILADFAAGTSIAPTVDGISTKFASFQNSAFSTFYNQLAGTSGYAAATIIKMCANDAAQPDASLKTALSYLIAQMTTNGDYIAPSTVSLGAQTAVGSPNGTGVVVGSVVRGDGLTLQTPFPETLTFTCTRDSQTGGATLNNENFSVVGAAPVSDATSYLWPGGSGVRGTLTSVDPTASNAGGNLTVNGSFETFSNGTSAAPPDNWVALVGAAQMSRAATPLFGTYSLEFTGDSATLTSVAQPFNTALSTGLGAGGSPAKLSPETVYIANVNYKLSAGSPAAGVLAMELVDGSNNIIADAASANNTANVNLNTIADTNWHNLSAAFRLPALLPATIKLRIRLSTALTTGTNVFLDGAALTAATQIYTGGPFFAIFGGSTKFLLNDQWTVALSNTYGVFAKMFERFFGLRALGLQFPYSGGGTSVSDALVS